MPIDHLFWMRYYLTHMLSVLPGSPYGDFRYCPTIKDNHVAGLRDRQRRYLWHLRRWLNKEAD